MTSIGRGRLAVAVVALLVGTVACGGASDDAAGDDPLIVGAWARTSPAMTSAGAAYMQITSADGDRLVAAEVDPAVAARVELHEMATMEMADDSMEEGDGSMAQGSETPMVMRELEDGVDLPAGEAVALEPGGYHVMLLDLPAPLEIGTTFDLTLKFEIAGTRTIGVEVRDVAP